LLHTGFVSNPLLPCQKKIGILYKRDLLLKPNDQFVTPVNYRVSSCQLWQRGERQRFKRGHVLLHWFVDLGAIVASECRFSYRKDFGTLLRPRSAEFLLGLVAAIVSSPGNLAVVFVPP
jgi:hypothetical protein